MSHHAPNEGNKWPTRRKKKLKKHSIYLFSILIPKETKRLKAPCNPPSRTSAISRFILVGNVCPPPLRALTHNLKICLQLPRLPDRLCLFKRKPPFHTCILEHMAEVLHLFPRRIVRGQFAKPHLANPALDELAL
ncbi:hypothetical protein I7I48_09459 [Histoplasma ohiense]|nr:hypothetical protein I7I48_09459 [Histoplasma ohiense (nom. inval.)]